MNAYAPSSAIVIAGVLAAALLGLGVGYVLQRTQRRIPAWLFMVAAIGLTDRALAGEPDGFRMIALLVMLAVAMKAVVAVEARVAGLPALTPARWLAFAGIWLGMQPREFVHAGPPLPAGRLAKSGALWVVAGAVTIALALQVAARAGPDWPRLSGYVLIAGCSMVLHFGFIALVAAGLRRLGFDVGPQFRQPWRSQSLQEFWARRWNVGFSVMTTITVYRPTVGVIGRTGALGLGFVASGLLHEVACSLPVGAGYGLPSLYFALQAVAVAAEHGLHRRGVRVGGWWGRLWVFGWVLLPLPLLFHDAFLDGVVAPVLW